MHTLDCSQDQVGDQVEGAVEKVKEFLESKLEDLKMKEGASFRLCTATDSDLAKLTTADPTSSAAAAAAGAESAPNIFSASKVGQYEQCCRRQP